MEEIEREQQSIDNIIIFACFTLLAAMIITLTLKKPLDKHTAYMVILSFLSLMMSLFELFCYKKRKPLRDLIYKQELESNMKKYYEHVYDGAMKFVVPYGTLEGITEQRKNPNIDEKSLNKHIEEKSKKKLNELIELYADSFRIDVEKAKEKAYRKPLKERFSRIKLCIDNLAEWTRIPFFVLGLIFLFISIVMTLT